MALLEHSPDIDHGVDIGFAGVFYGPETGGSRQENRTALSCERSARRGLPISEGEHRQRPSALVVSPRRTGFGVCQTNDRAEWSACRSLSLWPDADSPVRRSMSDGLYMVAFHSVMSVLDEISLRTSVADAFASVNDFRGALSILAHSRSKSISSLAMA